jgi:hypothetical protein
MPVISRYYINRRSESTALGLTRRLPPVALELRPLPPGLPIVGERCAREESWNRSSPERVRCPSFRRLVGPPQDRAATREPGSNWRTLGSPAFSRPAGEAPVGKPNPRLPGKAVRRLAHPNSKSEGRSRRGATRRQTSRSLKRLRPGKPSASPSSERCSRSATSIAQRLDRLFDLFTLYDK